MAENERILHIFGRILYSLAAASDIPPTGKRMHLPYAEGCGGIRTEGYAGGAGLNGCVPEAVSGEGSKLRAADGPIDGKFFRTLSRQLLVVYDGVKDTLKELHHRGKHLYLLSNAQSDFTRPELEIMGLTEFFDGILISSEEGCKKPCPAFFRRLIERYDLDPARCLMTGNEENSDIAGACYVGMDSLYLHTATSSKPQGKYKSTYCVMDGDWKKVAEILLEGNMRNS